MTLQDVFVEFEAEAALILKKVAEISEHGVRQWPHFEGVLLRGS
jgi:hypothetical protein